MELKNIQILLETMTRCGGNCSGCALASVERMLKNTFDFSQLERQKEKVNYYLNQTNEKEIESISIFLGQGDHFLMAEEDIENFVKLSSFLVPKSLKHKTVIFITASAIGKHEVIRKKMDLFYQYSLKYEIPFFIQVVFDPKKMLVSEKFKDIYLSNILYFKEKCGMTELTINLGEDLYNYITPQDFHNWIGLHKFKHVEINWVLNKETHNMWKNGSVKMFAWLKEWLLIYKNEKLYEINFIPFMTRSFLNKNIKFMQMKEKIISTLKDNIYIDSQENLLVCQMGLISNLTPMEERLIHNENDIKNIEKIAEIQTNKIIKKLLKRPSCGACEYKNICATSGATSWFNYEENQNDIYSCPWNIVEFLQFLETHFVSDDFSGKTIFDKNPVQNIKIIKDNNATHSYFEKNSLILNDRDI